jgi:hypothetical protein
VTDADRKVAALEYKARDIGFTWGQLSVLVPVVAVLVVTASLDVTLNEELLVEHRWVSPLIFGGFVGWVKFMGWAGVGRLDPKRIYDDDDDE